MKKKGSVKWFDPRKGYGFITGDDGIDYFVHYSNIEGDGYRSLHIGEHVEFNVANNSKGRSMAVDVTR